MVRLEMRLERREVVMMNGFARYNLSARYGQQLRSDNRHTQFFFPIYAYGSVRSKRLLPP